MEGFFVGSGVCRELSRERLSSRRNPKPLERKVRKGKKGNIEKINEEGVSVSLFAFLRALCDLCV